MIYACLQVIARERESGISVLDLGKSTGYDQKTCFYIVKQLLELNLVSVISPGGHELIDSYFTTASSCVAVEVARISVFISIFLNGVRFGNKSVMKRTVPVKRL